MKLRILVNKLVLYGNPRFYKVGRSGSLANAVLVFAPKILRNRMLPYDFDKTIHSIFMNLKILVDTCPLCESQLL